jgi:hypothetical protein
MGLVDGVLVCKFDRFARSVKHPRRVPFITARAQSDSPSDR